MINLIIKAQFGAINATQQTAWEILLTPIEPKPYDIIF